MAADDPSDVDEVILDITAINSFDDEGLVVSKEEVSQVVSSLPLSDLECLEWNNILRYPQK